MPHVRAMSPTGAAEMVGATVLAGVPSVVVDACDEAGPISPPASATVARSRSLRVDQAWFYPRQDTPRRASLRQAQAREVARVLPPEPVALLVRPRPLVVRRVPARLRARVAAMRKGR